MFEGAEAVGGLDSSYKGCLLSIGILFPSRNSLRFKQAPKTVFTKCNHNASSKPWVVAVVVFFFFSAIGVFQFYHIEPCVYLSLTPGSTSSVPSLS